MGPGKQLANTSVPVPCARRPGHPPADLIRQREMKWVEMTSHWEKTMSRRYKKVRGGWGSLAHPPLPLPTPSCVPAPPVFSPYDPKGPLPQDRLGPGTCQQEQGKLAWLI